MKKRFNELKSYIRSNVWSAVTILIVVFMLYVIGRNVIHAIQIQYEISLLNSESREYQERITRDSTVIERLNDDAELERYAREKFMMQRKNEEIFIIKSGK